MDIIEIAVRTLTGKELSFKINLADVLWEEYGISDSATLTKIIRTKLSSSSNLQSEDEGTRTNPDQSAKDDTDADADMRDERNENAPADEVPMITTKTVEPFKGKHLKDLVENKEGIPPAQQRLVFNGKVLDDDKPFKEYNVKNGNTIHLVLALRGGGVDLQY